jgi:tetratricopeptide (TPR) repeat protein
MFSIRCTRWTVAAFALTAALAPVSVFAQTPERPQDSAAQFPTRNDLKALTTSGSYLAARHAGVERDATSAAAFYRSALRSDPKNSELLDRAFISSVADGDIDEAVRLAEKILSVDKTNRVARLVVGVQDLKQKKYGPAQLNINQSIRGPITDLVATLLSAWASYGAGDAKTAVANIDKLTGMVPAVQGPACRHDPRTLGQGKGRRRTLRARLQARRFHAAHLGGLCALAVAQQERRSGNPDLRSL